MLPLIPRQEPEGGTGSETTTCISTDEDARKSDVSGASWQSSEGFTRGRAKTEFLSQDWQPLWDSNTCSTATPRLRSSLETEAIDLQGISLRPEKS